MARKPLIFGPEQREQRQRSYEAAASLASRFPRVRTLAIDLRFTEPGGKPCQSPSRWIFTPDMQAYFELRCPMPDCSEGGYDLGEAIARAISRGAGGPVPGQLQCAGQRPGSDQPAQRCDVTLAYGISVES